jgi:hypothetical protein
VRAAAQQILTRGHVEVALHFFAAVAFEAVLLQKGRHLLLKRLQAAGHALGMIRRQIRSEGRTRAEERKGVASPIINVNGAYTLDECLMPFSCRSYV